MSDGELEARLLVLARGGDVEGLLELAFADGVEEPEHLAYKWLSVAADLGFEQADDAIDDLLTGPLHADDDNFVSGRAHFELGVAYLTGADGLPVDLEQGRRHLAEMLARHYPASVQGGDGMLAEAARGMAPPARAVFEECTSRAAEPAP